MKASGKTDNKINRKIIKNFDRSLKEIFKNFDPDNHVKNKLDGEVDS